MAKLQINAAGGIGESQSLPSDLMDRMKAYEATVQKQRKSDAFDSAYNSLIEEYDRYKNGNKKSILSVRESSDNLLAEIERDRDSYTDIYGEERYSELYSNIKGISDDVRSAMNESLEDAKEKAKAEEEAKNALPEFDRIAFENSLLATQKKQENTPVRNPSEPISPLMQNVMGGVETPIEIPNAHDDRDKLMNAQAAFGKYVEEKEQEGKTIPSVKEEDKPKATFGENALGFAQTASTNLALGAANSISSIVNGLEQAIGDAASGGAYSDGFKVMSDYFGAMPSELRTEVLAELGTEGHPNRPTRIGSVSRATGVSQNVIEQYAKSVQNENMRESVLNSGYAEKMDSALKEHTADIAFSIGQQIPGLMLSGALSGATSATSAIGSAIGANPSTVLIGMSVAGNEAFNLAREKGYNPSIYAEAVMQGGIEMILEGLIGFSDVASYQKLMTNTGSTVGNVAKSFIKYIVSGAEEGLEEVINIPLSNLTSMMFGEDKKVGFGEGDVFDYKEMIKSGMSGAAVGLIMGGVMGTSMAVSAVKEGADIRYNADWLNKMAQKLPEHYRPATVNATKATEKDIENYGKELTSAFNKYMTDSMNGKAVLSNKDKYGEDVASVTEDNSTVQLADQAEVLAHVQAEDTEGAKEIIEQKIQHYNEMAEALADDESLKEISGEGTAEKIASNVARLTETKDMLDAGTYNADEAQKVISAQMQKKIAEGKKTTAAARQFAETVKSNLGVVQGERAIAHTVELLEADVKNGVNGASVQLKVAKKALDSIRKEPSSAVRSLLGNTEKELGAAISDSSKKRSVQFDYSMPEGSYASYNRGTGTVKINPMSVLMAQSQMDNGNKARSEFVHEAGHIAAQMDASFVSKVYDVYTKLRADKVIPENGLGGLNETDIREAYRKDKSLSNYLNTATVKNGIKQLVAQGATVEQARDSFAEAFLQEEIAMHFLSWAENNGANLYNTIVPEKRNAFVEAMRKIAQFFRDVAAKIRGKDPASAKKMDTLADKLYNAVRDFAGGSTTAQESVNAKTTENTTATESGVPEGSTGTQEADERKSLVITEDNRPVAVIEEDILDGVPESEWRSKAKQIMAERFPDGVIVSGEKVKINRNSRNEFTKSVYSERLRKRNPDFFADKMRLSASIDDVIIASTDRLMDGGLRHNRKDNYVDFSHGNVLLQVGNNKYSADVVVGYTDNGEAVLYDVVRLNTASFEIKDSGNKGHRGGVSTSPNINVSATDNSVTQIGSSVNGENEDVRKSISYDSAGRKLSDKQAEYFSDSKVRDEDGNLKVMYHGTPNGEFTVFHDGTYFTENKEYADKYQNPGASSLNSRKTVTSPKTYEVYLNIKKPFDLSDPEARDIYINDYIKGGNAIGINPYLPDAEYARISSIDWTEGEDLREFLIDNEYDYDGLVLDEGAVGGYGDAVEHRGTSYVIFSPEQVKAVDNLNPTEDPDIRYSLSEAGEGKATESYAEIMQKQMELNQRENALRERKQEVTNNPELLQAMDDYHSLFDEMRELLPKRKQGTATQAELDRIEEIKVQRDEGLLRISELQESLGLNAISKEETEIREMREALRIAADEAWEREGAEKENLAIQKAGVSAEEYFRKKALEAFKTTTNFNESGYLLPDGKLLNFSGGERNHRYWDHREIGEIYEATSGTAALNRFLNDGNIRIMAESPGIDIASSVAPTQEQYAAIRKFINSHGVKEGHFYVDFSDAEGRRAGNYSYDGRVNADRIINDIKHYYETGEVRQQSAFDKFRFSISSDPDDIRYSKDTSFTKDKYFDRQIDKWSELRDNSYVKVGVIKSESALHAVGVPTGGLYFDVSKIKKEMESHGDHLTVDTLKGIPALLNNPITLTEYRPGTNSNTVSVYGNLFANGVPVTVGVVMIRGAGGTVISKIRTIHARSNLKNQITDKSVLYIGENKKETNAWYQTCGIDVPLGGTQLGVIRSIDFKESIPQPNEFVKTSDEDSRNSLVLDSEYMSAVERGDMAEAQRMVDEAARAAGYNYHLYHGTDADFTKFDLRKFGGRNGKGEGYGIYLAANREISKPYGKNVINSYTKFNRLAEGRKRTLTKAEVKKIIQKSCEIEARRMVDDGEYDSIAEAIKDTWVSNYVYTYDYPNMSRVYTDVADIVFGGNDNDGEIINEIMSASGGHYNYDGALDFYENVLTPTTGIDGFHYIWGNADGSGVQNDIYLAFSSEQIKSADPVTYDDNGNVIPLSERFNPENDDIRYSKETTDKRIARLKEDKEFLKQQMEKSRSVALSPDDVDKIVKEMRDQFGFDNSERDNVKKMLELIDKVANKKIRPERMDEVWDSLARGARSILEGVYEVDASLMKENEAFIKHIRSTPLSVPEENENDFAGGYAEYRNENRKYVNLSRNGTPIDSVYEELCGQYPGVLDSTIDNPADQIEEIVRVMKSFEPEDVPSYADTIDQAAQEFAHVLGVKYMNTAQKTYFSDIHDEVSKLNRENRQTVTAYEARFRSIESAAARDAKEYERIINRYKNIEDAREFAGDRKEYARRIRQDARALRSAAVSPNSKKFVPEKYRGNVERIAEFLDYVSTGRVNLNSDIAEPWAGIARIREDFRVVSEMFSEDFSGLAMGILQQMEFYTSGLSQMENKDLKAAIFYRDAYKLGRLMRKSIADMNKVYLLEKRVAASMVANEITETLNHRRSTQKEFESLGDKKSGKIMNVVFNKNLSFTDARSFFHRMGKAGDNIYETLRDAQSRQYLYIKQYTDAVGEKLKDIDLSQYAGDKQKTVTVTLSTGKEYTLTAAQAMNIVTLYERESGKSHIENGGVRIYNPKTRQASIATALTEKDIVSLRNALDETAKKVMRVLSDFMRNECTAWGNEATMEKYGFHRFTTKDYFPISVDRTATGADMKSYAPAQFNVENVGFAKPTKDNASAPVMIDSMIDVANNHIRGMASYAAYLNVEDGINRIMKVPGVVDTMKRALGSEAEKYITEMMNDLKGAGKTEELADNTVDLLNKFAGRYKAAAVSYNTSTVAKQPLSYLRAAAVLDAKYLVKGASGNHKVAYDEMMKHSGIAVRKEIGYSDVGVGKTIGEQIGYTERGTLKSGVRKFNEFGMAGAALADRVTWESIWLACKAEQMEKNASAAIDHDKLMQATAKRFADVVAQTQVVDSALDSAPVSRSNNPLVRLTYAFMSEPIKGYNLLVNALDDFFTSPDKEAKKRAAKHLARVSAYTLLGWAAEAAITSAFSAIRDDDDEFVDKFSETYFGNLGQNALGILPMADPIVDAFLEVFKGYTPSNMADQTLIDVASAMVDAYKTFKDPEGKRETKLKAGRDAVESVATMLGVPVKNIVRMVNNTAKSAFQITNAYKASYEWQKIWYNQNNATAREKNGFNSILADAYLSGDKEAFEYIYEDMRKMGLKPQQLVNSIAKDAFEGDIADSDKSTLVKYTPGSDAWYIGMKTIFNRDEKAPKATEDEITRVYKATGETSVLPKFKSGEYTVDGVSKEFDGEALDKYLDDYGRLYYEVANAMRDLAAYRKGSAEEQAWWLTKAEKYASAVAVYTQDKDYSVTSVGKWVSDYVSKKPYEVAKYIVGNLEKK